MNHPTEAELERALDYLALIIDSQGSKGDVYWPLFDRLESELKGLQARTDKIRSRLNKRDRPKSGNTRSSQKP